MARSDLSVSEANWSAVPLLVSAAVTMSRLFLSAGEACSSKRPLAVTALRTSDCEVQFWQAIGLRVCSG